MTIHFLCDKCLSVLSKKNQRYQMRVELFAAADSLEFSRADLEKDHSEEMNKILKELEKMDSKEVEDQVYVKFEFDLCQSCRDALYTFLKNLPSTQKQLE